jgi:uncharacterized protein (DUF697 family)
METIETKEPKAKGAESKPLESGVWEDRKAETDRIIHNHVYGAMGIGLIPVPMVDFLALTGLQVRLLCKLAQFYGVDFSASKVKSIVSALVGSFVPVAAAGPLGSMIKLLPVIGQTAGALTMLATAGASTYALGRVFVQHFESGGTFLDFEPENVRAYFAEQFKEGQKIATDLRKPAAPKS